MTTEMDATDRKCSPCCGMTWEAFSESPLFFGEAYPQACRRNDIVYCSPTCREVAPKPPIAAPSHKIDVKATVDGKCPLCGVAVPSTHIHLCSQPQHAERRKGQRYKGPIGEVYVLSFLGTARWYADCGEIKGLPMPREDQPDLWRDYTLLADADAPAEPGKPWCVSCGCGGGACDYMHLPNCPNYKAPPAHEAPKAAPVCCVRDKGHVCEGPLLKRVIGPRYATVTDFCCDMGMQNFEKAAASAGFKQSGTPYKGPERLRNVLARDEGIESDCLGEVR